MKRQTKLKSPRYIPLSTPEIGQEEIRNVVNCVKSGWLSTGELNFEFERLLAKYLAAKEVICLDSCTSALFLSLLVLGIGKGDEVITTPFTFASTANVIVHSGATPVFCDIEENSYNIDAQEIRKKITKRTKAIIPVHFAGYPCNQQYIYDIADKYGLSVIEDAAHALGSTFYGKKIGSFPGLSCFSFYATKNITTGEGGCISLQNKKLANKIRMFRFHGISKDAWKRYHRGGKWRYDIVYAGYKSNMTDVLASIGIAQIKKIERFLRKRRRIADKYYSNLYNCQGLILPPRNTNKGHSWHLYACRIDRKNFGISRDQFMLSMQRKGIGTSVHYIPIHLHSYYRRAFGYKKGQFPISEKIGNGIVSLPIYTKMTEADVDRVIQGIYSIKKRSH